MAANSMFSPETRICFNLQLYANIAGADMTLYKS